ncbi:hypothetical protein B0H66DRAFT_622430 [Apodospora peruviana]|uniref:Uncharacterized protein n=1 Tax=Apodospora peruviana TaxID=516989 RepID=A0AAE0M476_9PEZI|nr:hypothetical protein B0H66DRAFT_622430 [Apodospora peruviana]
MKGLSLLLSAGLVSAVRFRRQDIQSGIAGANILNGSVIANNSDIAGVNEQLDANINDNLDNLDNLNNNNINDNNVDKINNVTAELNQGGLNLDNLNIDGLDLNSIDLNNQDALAQGILAMLGGLCLNNALGLDNILNLGQDNELELFLELQQLIQLEQLGFLSGGGIRGLFNSGFLFGNFNLGIFKREVAEAKKIMRRTKLRRGSKAKRQGCTSLDSAPFVGSVDPAAFAAPSLDGLALPPVRAVDQAANAVVPEVAAATRAANAVSIAAAPEAAAATVVSAAAAASPAAVNSTPEAAAA